MMFACPDPAKYLNEIHAALGCHPAFMVEEIERLRDETEEVMKRISSALGLPSDSDILTIIESCRSIDRYEIPLTPQPDQT